MAHRRGPRVRAIALVLILLGSTSGVAAAATAAGAPASTGAPAVLGPGEASGFFTIAGGKDYRGARPVADVSTGYDVWIDAGGAHNDRIAPAIAYAVGQLRVHGIDVHYRGVARPGQHISGTGTIDVGEATEAQPALCRRTKSADAGLLTEAVTFPYTQDVGVAYRLNAAEVTFCPPLWSHGNDYVTAMALHEMGHAVGLGHFPDLYEGGVQMMNPIVPDLQDYQPGDVNGLRYIVAQTALLRSAGAVSGAVDSWQVTRRGLAVSGWAIVGRATEFADVGVTRDGRSVYSITTNSPRPDIVARYGSRWPTPGFDGAQIPMLTGRHRYCVVASEPGGSARTAATLACRDLAFPPPETAPVAPTTPQPGTAMLVGMPIHAWWSSVGARLGIGAVGALGVLILLVVVVRRRVR